MIDRSESCATRKLLQCTDFGVYVNEVTDKFVNGSGSTDLTPAEFRARKAIVTQVMRWCEKNEKSSKQFVPNNEWAAILYKYEASTTDERCMVRVLTYNARVDRQDSSKVRGTWYATRESNVNSNIPVA